MTRQHRDRFSIKATCISCNHSCHGNLIYLVTSIALALDRLVRFINKFQVDLSMTGGEWNGQWTRLNAPSCIHLITYIINHNNIISFILLFFYSCPFLCQGENVKKGYRLAMLLTSRIPCENNFTVMQRLQKRVPVDHSIVPIERNINEESFLSERTLQKVSYEKKVPMAESYL